MKAEELKLIVEEGEGYLIEFKEKPAQIDREVALEKKGHPVNLNEGLNEGLKSLLAVISQNPGIQTRQASALLDNRSVKTLEKQIQTLVEKSLIEHQGSKKTGGYFLKG